MKHNKIYLSQTAYQLEDTNIIGNDKIDEIQEAINVRNRERRKKFIGIMVGAAIVVASLLTAEYFHIKSMNYQEPLATFHLEQDIDGRPIWVENK